MSLPILMLLAIVTSQTPDGGLGGPRMQLQGDVQADNIFDAAIAQARARQFGLDLPESEAMRYVRHVLSLPSDLEIEEAAIPEALSDAIQRLNSASFAEREQACADLDDPTFTILELLAALTKSDLSLEQRSRLFEAARSRVVSDPPRAAMGISMPVVDDRVAGVIITDTIDGFPADGLLFRNDRIIQIDGIAVLSREDLSVLVQIRRPGDTINLTVIRPEVDDKGAPKFDDRGLPIEHPIDLMIELGSFDELWRHDLAQARGQNRWLGRPSVSSFVTQLRNSRESELVDRFAAKPTVIESDSGDFRPRTESQKQRDVRAHPYVARLTHEVDLIRAGSMQVTEALRRTWRLLLDEIVQTSNDPQLSREDQEYLFRVRDEFRRLMPE